MRTSSYIDLKALTNFVNWGTTKRLSKIDLKNKSLTEDDYRKYILEHYTFLSRPVFIIENKIYIGNSQKNILEVLKVLS